MTRDLWRHSEAVIVAICVLAAVGCEPASVTPGDVSNAIIDARTALRRAAEDPDGLTRSHAIEAMAKVMPQESGVLFVQALDDEKPVVRFAAALAVGETKYAPAKDKLVAMANDKKAEPDKRVLCAVIYALDRLGEKSYNYELANLLFDQDSPDARGNAAMVMGKMGEPSAIGPLKTLLVDEKDPAVQLTTYESLAILGDTRSQYLLEAYVRGPFQDLRLEAIPALAKVDSRRASYVLHGLLDNDKNPRVRVAAAWQLAELGEMAESGYRLSVDAARNPQQITLDAYGGDRTKVKDVEVLSLQRLAAIALGTMKRTEAVGTLHRLLKSPDGGVRVAAAMAVIKLLGPNEKVAPKPDQQSTPEQPKGEAPTTRPKLHIAPARE